MLAPGSQLAGYRIEREIGRGGMGVVYHATQVSLARPVALKLIAAELAEEADFRSRFEREARLAASIDHPNVITVYETGEHDGVLFIAMRLIEGADLRDLISRRGRLEAPRAARIVAQVGAALDAAHARGLVHRDVKPGNVLVASSEGEEHAYLTDFGLVKRAASALSLTPTGGWVGTVDYIAPEQIQGEEVDGRADVYSLGCVLFEALTGRTPFSRDTQIATLWAHMTEPPPAPSDTSELPEQLDELILRALAKAPADRYSSAGQLGRSLVAALRSRAAGDGSPPSESSPGAVTHAPGQEFHEVSPRGSRPRRMSVDADARPADSSPSPTLFDVFLYHHTRDERVVGRMAEKLRRARA